MPRKKMWMVIAIVLLALALGAGGWFLLPRRGGAAAFRTATVKRGDLVATIGATGTVEPEEVVDVGAQVAGQILTFGKDKDGKPIDYGSAVEENTVLAQIDDSLYRADMETARAGVVRAQADLAQSQAKLEQAQRDWERAQKLGPSEALSKSAYDQYKAGFDTATAAVGVSAASVVQAQAALDRTQRNLGYCTIRSPVRGVIIDRRVNIGQTVVSSLNAPSLFLIAKDLKRIQVWVSVNEADVGQIHAGQPVSFTVDSFPGRVFKGQVGKVRLNATMTQNVVTYTVEVNADNSDGKLLPYLTATAQFETGRRENVLLVPNTALRWVPRAAQIVPEFRQAAEAPAAPRKQGGAEGVGRQRSLWMQQGGLVRPLTVTAGLSDGSLTEVSGGELAEGMLVVLGETTAQSAAAIPAGEEKSPFAPQLRRSGTQGGGGGTQGGGGGR